MDFKFGTAGWKLVTRQMVMAFSAASFLLQYPGVALAEPETVAGEMSIAVTVDAPADNTDTKLWVPLPVSDKFQTIEDVKIEGNFAHQGIYKEKTTGNSMVFADWSTAPAEQRQLTLTFKVTTHKRENRDFVDRGLPIPSNVKQFIKAEAMVPTGGRVKKIGDEAAAGKVKVSEKARSVYDWVVDNTFRDPAVQGCGVGDVEQTLDKKGGKCTDISSVFVAIARSAGIPAREVFGIRLGKDDGISDMTGGHHCWAEYYVPGAGWVPADPADVRKAILVNKLENDPAEAGKYREYYFNAVDPYRIAVAMGGRGYYLNPPQKGGPLNYFMYPYAEIDGKPVAWLAAQKELKYKITFKKS